MGPGGKRNFHQEMKVYLYYVKTDGAKGGGSLSSKFNNKLLIKVLNLNVQQCDEMNPSRECVL